MRNIHFPGALLVLALSAGASAQDLPSGQSFPGSANFSAGTISPLERGNVISSLTVDQAASVWQPGSVFVLGYTSVSLRSDTQGYQWNANTPFAVGVRVVKSWPAGTLQANMGLSIVARTASDTPVGPIGYVSYWSGWRNDRSASMPLDLAFPGHIWASSGFVTPLERGNWLTTVSAEEGVSVTAMGLFGVVPYGAATLVVDTHGLAWNNKSTVDAGVKIQRFVPGGVIEAGVARRNERQRSGGTSQSGAVVFLNFWLGWDPRRVSK